MMRNFIRKLALFGGTIFVLAIVFQALISWHIKDKNLRGTDNLHEKAVDADLILLGSSRCWAHFDPAFFKKTYGLKTANIGVNGHSEIEMAILRLNNYLSKNKKPKYAIFSFDPFVNADSNDSVPNFVVKNDYARYAFFPDKNDLPILNFFKFTFAEKYVPLYAVFKYKGLKDVFMPLKINHSRDFGYENNDAQWDTIQNPVSTVMKKHFFKPAQMPAIKDGLCELRDLCAKNNIRLLCVQTPVYSVIYDSEIFSKTAKICDDLGIPFVDVNAPQIRNDISNFYNSNHMNRKGVNMMNGLLKQNTELNSFFELPAK